MLKTNLLSSNAIETNKKVDLAVQSININIANEKELIYLPGIGPELAKRIVDYRKLNGNYSKPEDLLRVKGIGYKKLGKIIKYIKIGPP